MTKDELVEKCARAMWAEGHLQSWDGPMIPGQCTTTEYDRDVYRSHARAALAIAMPAAFEMAAKVADKRAEARFADFGTTEWDTNASYYSGRRGEALNELDEEDAEIAQAIRAEGEKWK